MKPEYLQSAEEVLCSQGSQRGGLTSQEAAARLNAAASAQPEEQGNPKEPEPAGQDIAPSPQ